MMNEDRNISLEDHSEGSAVKLDSISQDECIDRATVFKKESELEQKRQLILKERSRALAKQSKFYEATSCLEDITTVTKSNHLGLNLLKAECYIQLGREYKAENAIKSVNKILEGETKVEADLLVSLGETLGEDESFIRSIILLRMASDIYKKSNLNPDEIVDGISRCIQESQQILAEVTKDKTGNLMDLLNLDQDNAADFLKKSLTATDSNISRVIVLDHGVEQMKDMLKDLRAVEGADPKKKALKEAWSCTHIGFVLGNVKEFDKSFSIRREGVDAMEKIYGERAGHHHVYGVLLHNMGIMRSNGDRHADATEMYQKALAAKEMAVDISGIQKQVEIEESRKSLERARIHARLG